ncbi:GGCX family protein [Megaselia abdita]
METFKNALENFTGHSWKNFSTIDNFILWIHRSVDASALGIFRFCFGLLMLVDIAEERGGSDLDVRYFDENICQFPLFPFIKPLSVPKMGAVYTIMWLGAIGIMLGYKFKLSCLMYSVCFWYILLLNKATWNNHSYLFGLCGFLFFISDADKAFSLNSWIHSSSANNQQVPYWNYFLIKYQFFILYFIAGLKKLSTEWLSGYAMTNLGHHWIFSPFRIFFSVQLTELLFIHWFAAIFDTSIAFFMIWETSRKYVLPIMMSFHLMNSRLFEIGMFPWVCLAQVQLFYPNNWMKSFKKRSQEKETTLCDRPVTFKEKIRTILIISYCGLQLFLPYSHFITKGYNNWTNGLYGYSWDMMISSYDTIATSIKIVDNSNSKTHFLEPYAFTEYDRWTKYADMAKQYAHCISDKLTNTLDNNPLESGNISIYFDVWCSMNRRFQQRVFHPSEDLLKAEWSPFQETQWVLPLLDQFNYMRPKIEQMAVNVYGWNNYSDALFIADFPGLTLENFISLDLENVTISVLEGQIEVGNINQTLGSLTAGESVKIKSGQTHFVKTVSTTPSTFMYTYINRTMMSLGTTITTPNDISIPNINLFEEMKERFYNYKKFLYNIGNSILFLIYKVPMPLRVRDIK